jgi:16S rRNA (cytidine1402-2'-O)-methyltransferase
LDEKLTAAMKSLSLKDATDAVAADTGMKRREVYQRALALAGNREKTR